MKHFLANLLFSRTCDGCGVDMARERGLYCWDCLTELTWIGPPYCACCGDPVDGNVPGEFICSWCNRVHPDFEWARSAVLYEGIVKDSLRRFKYHNGLWACDGLVDWLENLLKAAARNKNWARVDIVVPVPLHVRRRRERGYNQAALLARGLARRLDVPMRNPLWRIRATSTQTRLSATQREANMRGAFTVFRPKSIQGKRILLVDDVMTTGATVNECARTLKKAGAKAVFVLTVARGC